jgi:alkylation response protein AidB-like acyl-CoA dehydrogenase
MTMDFTFTAEDQAFRAEVREFIQANWGLGDLVGGVAGESEDEFPRMRAFEKKLAERGWLTMAWPQEYGGGGASHIRQMIFREECAYHGAPGSGGQGINMIGPCLMVHGNEEQRRRFLPPIASADIVWCQGFSEPGSGSDLASLQTRAVADGDDYVLNGQKIWTSNAQHADWIHILARTDPDAPKHRGITYFLLDMKTPGISVRPIQQMHGRSGFNETFFENVRVPRENVVGEVNRGWYAAATTLDFERSGVGRFAGGIRTLEMLTDFCKATSIGGVPLIKKPGVAAKLAELKIEHEVGRFIAYRVSWMQGAGRIPNYEASMSKLYGSELTQRLGQAGVNIMGLYGGLYEGTRWAPLEAKMQVLYLSGASSTIAAGTSEVQRNIMATRGLGLPRG